MNNSVQLIFMKQASDHDRSKLEDLLRFYNVSCFGVGEHLIAVFMKPYGINIPKHFHVDLLAVLKYPNVTKAMESCHARYLSFSDGLFNKLKSAFSKQYILKHATPNTLTFKSKTQPADFTLHKNGIVRTSKDLLAVPLWTNIANVVLGQKLIDPTNSL